MNSKGPEEYMRQRRLIMVHLVIALVIQIVVLASYYFVEKQVMLAFPMILGIFITVSAIVAFSRLDK